MTLSRNIDTGFPDLSDVKRRLKEAETVLNGYIPQENWTAPSLENSWVNYGGGYQDAEYMKDSLGFIHLRGLIKDGTVNNTAFTLPDGYRPENRLVFGVISNNSLGQIDVLTDGTVFIDAICSNTYVSLNGVYFYAKKRR